MQQDVLQSKSRNTGRYLALAVMTEFNNIRNWIFNKYKYWEIIKDKTMNVYAIQHGGERNAVIPAL